MILAGGTKSAASAAEQSFQRKELEKKGLTGCRRRKYLPLGYVEREESKVEKVLESEEGRAQGTGAPTSYAVITSVPGAARPGTAPADLTRDTIFLTSSLPSPICRVRAL